MENFICSISHSESAFVKKYGKELFEILKRKTFKKSNYCCDGCGYDPFSIPGFDAKNLNKSLEAHLVEVNEKNPVDSKFKTLCKACHATQHIDTAATNNWVELVNSYLSQAQIINACRTNSIKLYLDDGTIRKLKKTPAELVNDLKTGERKNNKVKVIFTEKFVF